MKNLLSQSSRVKQHCARVGCGCTSGTLTERKRQPSTFRRTLPLGMAALLNLWLSLTLSLPLTVTAGTIELSWSPSQNCTIYQVWRGTEAATVFNLVTNVMVPVTSTVIESQGGTELFYVTAIGPTGESQPSNIWTNIGIPSVPSSFQATAISADRIDLVFFPSSSTDQVAIDVAADPTIFKTVAIVPTPITFYRVIGLRKKTKYFFQIRAGNSSGWSPNSPTISATTYAK